LGALRGEDLPAPALALKLGKDKKQVYRYERGDDRASEGTVDVFVGLCRAVGLPITASWLERGETELPPIVVPASALAAPMEAVSPPAIVAHSPIRETRKRKVLSPAQKAAQARKASGRKGRG